MKIDSREFVQKSQGYQLTQLGTIGVVRARTQVYVDSYDNQCRARLEVWSPTDLRWNLCTSLESETVAEDAPSFYLPKTSENEIRQFDHCVRVSDRMVRDAELVLGVVV